MGTPVGLPRCPKHGQTSHTRWTVGSGHTFRCEEGVGEFAAPMTAEPLVEPCEHRFIVTLGIIDPDHERYGEVTGWECQECSTPFAARVRAAEPDTVTVDWQAFDRDVLGEPDTVTALADEARLVAQWADAVDPMPDELRAELHDLGVHAARMRAAQPMCAACKHPATDHDEMGWDCTRDDCDCESYEQCSHHCEGGHFDGDDMVMQEQRAYGQGYDDAVAGRNRWAAWGVKAEELAAEPGRRLLAAPEAVEGGDG